MTFKEKKLKLKRIVKEIEDRSISIDKETKTLLKYIDKVHHLIPEGVCNKIKTHLQTIKYQNREIK